MAMETQNFDPFTLSAWEVDFDDDDEVYVVAPTAVIAAQLALDLVNAECNGADNPDDASIVTNVIVIADSVRKVATFTK